MFIRTSRVGRPEERQTPLNRVFNRLIALLRAGRRGLPDPERNIVYRDRALAAVYTFYPRSIDHVPGHAWSDTSGPERSQVQRLLCRSDARGDTCSRE